MATPRRSSSLSYLIAFPLLIVPFTLYNMIAFLLDLKFSERVFDVSLLSGVTMDVSIGDVLVIVGVLLLYFEILKSTRLLSKEIMDHVLSLMLFIGMSIEFISVPRTATPTFLILLSLCFIDVIGGFTIGTAQRDIAIDTPDRV
jgi:hypothetical protein